jgi:putative flippase GtrA
MIFNYFATKVAAIIMSYFYNARIDFINGHEAFMNSYGKNIQSGYIGNSMCCAIRYNIFGIATGNDMAVIFAIE